MGKVHFDDILAPTFTTASLIGDRSVDSEALAAHILKEIDEDLEEMEFMGKRPRPRPRPKGK